MKADSNGFFIYKISSASKLIMKMVINLEGRNDKDLRMIKCRSTRIFKPEHNPDKFVLVADQFNMDESKLNWGLMSGIYPAV